MCTGFSLDSMTAEMQRMSKARGTIMDLLAPKAVPQYDYKPRSFYDKLDLAPLSANEEKENKMRSETYVTLDASRGYSAEQESKSHLRSRIGSLFSVKDRELETKFGLRSAERPATLNEMVKAIKDGQFKIKDDHGDDTCYYYLDYVIWGDPSIKIDRSGYNAAIKLLQKKYNEVNDIIEVLSPTEGLAALKDFENFTV